MGNCGNLSINPAPPPNYLFEKLSFISVVYYLAEHRVFFLVISMTVSMLMTISVSTFVLMP